MKLVLLATTLLFYSQVIETKDCLNYEITSSLLNIEAALAECEKLEGVLASEDLLDSENMEKAAFAINKFRSENSGDDAVWVDIASQDPASKPSGSNPYVFSDRTEVKDTNMLIKWAKPDQPIYHDTDKCAELSSRGLKTKSCLSSNNGLCRKVVECSSNSGSNLSRANLPVFALFMTGGVFKAFYALVGPVE